jgi:hypothetical protein
MSRVIQGAASSARVWAAFPWASAQNPTLILDDEAVGIAPGQRLGVAQRVHQIRIPSAHAFACPGTGRIDRR